MAKWTWVDLIDMKLRLPFLTLPLLLFIYIIYLYSLLHVSPFEVQGNVIFRHRLNRNGECEFAIIHETEHNLLIKIEVMKGFRIVILIKSCFNYSIYRFHLNLSLLLKN